MTKRNSFIESTKETDERLEALKQFYPEIFSDGKINLDAFKDVTGTSDLPEGQDRTPGYYGLYWPGKRAAKQLARKEAEGTLEPVPGDGVNEDTTHNIYIEGDNLEVLRILKQSYKGRVKMIYIDPPYNTGNDFIYPDDFKMPVEEYLKMTGQADEGGKKLVTNLKSNGAFHTTWLNMMYPRLQLARELLTEDGVIFISIDDNEQSNLKLLCDDVFGEENFIADMIWQGGKKSSGNLVGINHEYLFVITKNRSVRDTSITAFRQKKQGLEKIYSKFEQLKKKYGNDFEKISSEMKEFYNSLSENDPAYAHRMYNLVDERGLFQSDNSSAPDKPETRSHRPLIHPITGKETLVPNMGWRFKDETLDKLVKENRIYFGEDETHVPRVKRYLKEYEYEIPSTVFYKPGSAASSELNKLFGAKIFENPKDRNEIQRLISFTTCNIQIDEEENETITPSLNEDIILDFFSGSATTAHAVMQLNAENKSKLKFIMVQLPFKCEDKSEAAKAGYKNICEIGKERIRRAGAKILEEAKSNKDMFSEDYQLDIGFKVYRLQNSNFVKYTPVEGQDEDSQNKLFEEFEKNQIPLVQDWKAENVLTEIILKQGFALDCTKENVDSFKKNTIWKITDSADAVSKKIKLYVCLDNSIDEETIKNLTLNDDEKFICLDAAIDDSAYARLADKGRIETI